MNDLAGLENLANALRGTPDDPRPLKNDGDKIGADGLACSLDGSTSLGIHLIPRRDQPTHWIEVAYCRAGQHSNIDAIAAAVGMTPADVRDRNETLHSKYRPGSFKKLPTETTIDGWVENLHNDPALVRYLADVRMLSLDVIRRRRIGYDGTHYTIPIYEQSGPFELLVNVRRYNRHPAPGEPKMLSWPGTSAALLGDIGRRRHLIVCEGEWDKLLLESLGLTSFTGTGGAECWWDEWSRPFAGRNAFLLFDRDGAGQSGSKKVAKSLRAVGCSVCVVELPMPYSRNHGPDVTDFVRAGGDVRALLNNAWERQNHGRSSAGTGSVRTISNRVVNPRPKTRRTHV